MRIRIFLFLMAVVVIGCGNFFSKTPTRFSDVRYLRCFDGDTCTFHVSFLGNILFQIKGIDAPELRGATNAAARHSRDALRGWLRSAKRIDLVGIQRKGSGLSGYLCINQQSAGARLIAEGLAIQTNPHAEPDCSTPWTETLTTINDITKWSLIFAIVLVLLVYAGWWYWSWPRREAKRYLKAVPNFPNAETLSTHPLTDVPCPALPAGMQHTHTLMLWVLTAISQAQQANLTEAAVEILSPQKRALVLEILKVRGYAARETKAGLHVRVTASGGKNNERE